MADPNGNTVTKKLWSYIKSKRQDNVGSAGPLSFQGETFTYPLVKAISLQTISLPYLQMKTLPVF